MWYVLAVILFVKQNILIPYKCNPRVTKTNHMWKNLLIFFFYILIIYIFYFWGALRKELLYERSRTWPLKTYVRLHNLISMNIFFNIKDHSFSLAFFFIIVKRKPKTNWLQKAFKNSDFFESNFKKNFLQNKGL